MSSVANCHNHSISVALSQSDNDEENLFDSSYNRQNESMMHKVKDVVSKIFHPSFLFSTHDDSTRSKRKRSISIEEHDNNDEQQTTTNDHITKSKSKSKYNREVIKDDEPEITDDEDNNSRDVPTTEQDLTEIEQQKKRRRTANYQHILSTNTTNSHDDDERTSSPLISTDSVRSLSNIRINQTSNTTPIRVQTSIEQNHNERINRLTASKQHFNILPTYRGPTSNYDPSKSPLFSAGNRKPSTEATTTTTNLKSNEFSANHLLASSLVSRPQPSSLLNRRQSPATLTKPVTNNNTNRLLSNERQMFGVNYASINSRRLPYIERLRRRTLEDSIRFNQTADNETLSGSVIKEHKSTTVSPAPKQTKVLEKECGIQCDILTAESSIESNKKTQRTFPPADIRVEALSVPTTEKTQPSSQVDSSIRTTSSITIEKIQSPVPSIHITNSKVLGNITPFSWPKFARAQEEYAKKYPEKCRSDAVVPSTIQKSNVNIIPTVLQQANTSASTNTMSKLPIFPFIPSRPAEAIWKCPSCTKEHPAQTASCSLCHGINPNYKKPSAIEAAKTIEKQPVLSHKLPDVITKEPSIFTSSITNTNQTIPTTTTKENLVSIPPAVTTNATSITFPPFGVTSVISAPITTKENSTTIIAPVTTSSTTPSFFGLTSTVSSSSTTTTTQENPISISVSRPVFGTAPIVSLPATTTQENPISTNASRPIFGVAPIVSTPPTTASKENSITSSVPPVFGITTTKENPVVSSTAPVFGTTIFDKASTTSTSSSFPTSTVFPPFVPPTFPSVSAAVTSSTVPSITTVTSTTSASTPFGTFGSTPIISTTTATPVVSTVSFSHLPAFTLTPGASAPSLTTSTAAPVVTTATSSFSAPSTTSTSTIPNTSPFASTATASASPAFGTGSLNFPSTSTTIASSNPPFKFGTGSPIISAASNVVSSMNTTSGSSFGTIVPFGTGNPFGTNTTFGTSAPFGTATPFGTSSTQADRPPSSVLPFSTSGTSNTPPTFGFGSTPNTTQASTAPTASTSGFPFGSTPNTIQTSTAPIVSTSGFAFGSPTPPVPVFGASPPTLSSPFSFGAIPPVSSNNTLFQFSGSISTPMENNLFSTPTASESTIDSSNPSSVVGTESTPTTFGRHIIKAKRRRP